MRERDKTIRMIFMILLLNIITTIYIHAQPLDRNYQYQINTPVSALYDKVHNTENLIKYEFGTKNHQTSHTNGDSLFICYRGNDYLYRDGKLYLDGSLHSGKVKGFLRQTVNALEKIKEGDEGATMINELDSSANTFVIMDGYGHFKTNNVCKAYANQIKTDTCQENILLSLNRTNTNIEGGSGGLVYWSPAGTVLPTAKGGVANPTLDLAHDMFHGLDANRGLLDTRLFKGLARSEWQTVFRENMLRSQLSLPLRTHYSWNVDVEGNFVGGSGRSMISINNLPIAPSWYKL